MNWKIEISPKALKSLTKFDKPVSKRIYKELREIEGLKDPYSRGKQLTGNLSGLWRYRVGDYRVICDIQDERLVILALSIDHRSKVYEAY